MKNFSKFIANMAKVVTKIVEVFQWVGAGLMLAATVCALVNPSWVGYFIGYDAKECCGADLSVYGFEIHAAVTDGQIDMTALCLFGIGAVLILTDRYDFQKSPSDYQKIRGKNAFSARQCAYVP